MPKLVEIMKSKIKMILSLVALFFALNLTPVDVQAQCPMCRMSAESNLKNGGTEGKGLNTGILYLLALPYLMVGTIGYVWWRNRPRDSQEPEAGL